MSNPTPDTGSMPGTALDTIGSVLAGDLGRDAIHLATIAVSSEERVYPSQHVGLVDVDKRLVSPNVAKLIGIVDPFLAAPVMPNDRFWLVLYPRTITSLRHVWEHPAFPEQQAVTASGWSVEASRAWLEDFADRLFSYGGEDGESKLETLIAGVAHGGGFGQDIEYGDGLSPSNEFWRHYENYTGRKVEDRFEYFSCSC